MSRQWIYRGGIALIVVLVLLVLIGNVATAHTNPDVTYTVQWDSPQTEALAQRACFACHSNETQWPWYSYIAPASFLVARDVNNGREAMNFSTGAGELETEEMIDEIREGEMPPRLFTILHPEAVLSDDEKAQLIEGLQKTFGAGSESSETEEDDD